MFRNKIQDAYDSLSPRFQRLAQYILENTLDVGFMTATELGSRVSVDPATVVRFAQELGYTGYRELSREIKHYVSEQVALRHRKGLLKHQDFEEKAALILDDMSDRLLDMKADIGLLITAARILLDAHHIYVTGTPEAYGLVVMWCTYLKMIGLPLHCIEANPVQAALMLRDATAGDVIVGIALGLNPGTELSQVLSAAKEKDIMTIAITTSASLKPARAAALNLVTNARTPLNYPSFDTLAALLSSLWQIIILCDEKRFTDNVTMAMASLDLIMQNSQDSGTYDPTVIKRQWEK